MKKPLNKIAVSIQRQRFNEICGFLLLCFFLMSLCVIVSIYLELGFSLIHSGLPLNDALLEALFTLNGGFGYMPYCLLALLAIWIWKGKKFFRTATWASRSMNVSTFIQILCVFLSVQFLTSYFSMYLERILNYWGLSAYMAMETASSENSPLSVIIYASIGAPIVEEFLFRGAILQSMNPCGKRFAIVFSSLLFGLFHGNIIQIPFAFLVGLILAYVAMEYSIWWSILLHFINNCVLSYFLSFFPVVQNVVIGVALIAALIILSIRANQIRDYHRSLQPMSREAVRGFWTAPLTIVFLVLMMLNAASTILPM